MNTERNWAPWVIGAGIIILVGVGFWLVGSSGKDATPGAASTSTPVAIETVPSRTIVQDMKKSSVATIVATLPEGSNFASYFSSTGVAATLTGKGPYTIFVPTNASFSLLTPGTITNLSAAEKKRLVQYHVVVGRALDLDALSNGIMQALSKDMLNFQANLTTGVAQVNNSYALRQYNASNGVVYLISAVLQPPAAQ